GTLGAHHARRPVAQRHGQGVRAGLGRRRGVHGGAPLLAHHAPVLDRRRAAAPRGDRARGARGDLPRGDALGGTQAACDRAHRRARAGSPRPVRRHGRILRLRGEHGHGDRDPHRARARGSCERPGGCGDRRGLGPRDRVRRVARQGRSGCACRPARGPAARRDVTGRRARRRAVLVALVLGGALLASGAPGWFSVEVVTLLQGEVRLTASGAQAVPALTGLGLVLLAAGAALGISGPVGRRVVGGFLLLAGVAAGWLVLAAVRSPGAALRRTGAEHTGAGAVPGAPPRPSGSPSSSAGWASRPGSARVRGPGRAGGSVAVRTARPTSPARTSRTTPRARGTLCPTGTTRPLPVGYPDPGP